MLAYERHGQNTINFTKIWAQLKVSRFIDFFFLGNSTEEAPPQRGTAAWRAERKERRAERKERREERKERREERQKRREERQKRREERREEHSQDRDRWHFW